MSEVTFKYNNREYTVPAGLTITAALEKAGYFFTRGVGCRAGFCGACTVTYTLPDDPQIKPALACQVVVQEDMDVARLAYLNAHKVDHDMREKHTPLALYPALDKCIECDACTVACPVDLNVMDFVVNLVEGELEDASDEFSICVMCQLCAHRCPVNIAPANAALYGRRHHAIYHTPPAVKLKSRVHAVNNGDYDDALETLVDMDEDALREAYRTRTIDVE